MSKTVNIQHGHAAPAPTTRPSLTVDELEQIIAALPPASPLAVRLYSVQQQAILRQSVRMMQRAPTQDTEPAPTPELMHYTSTTLMLSGIPVPQHKVIYELLMQGTEQAYTKAQEIVQAVGTADPDTLPSLEQVQAAVEAMQSMEQDTPADLWSKLW